MCCEGKPWESYIVLQKSQKLFEIFEYFLVLFKDPLNIVVAFEKGLVNFLVGNLDRS